MIEVNLKINYFKKQSNSAFLKVDSALYFMQNLLTVNFRYKQKQIK